MNIHKGFLFLLLLALAGCLGGARPAPVIQYYQLSYAAPGFTGLAPCPRTIQMERLTANRVFDSRAMIYRSGAFELADYPSGHWRVAPADMLTDCLSRDFREARLFPSLSTYRDNGDARFILEGNVEEFMEIRVKEQSLASLVIRIYCVDTTKKGAAERVVWEKLYAVREPLKDRTPEALATAMSAAMEKLTRQLITDIHHILQKAT